MSFYQKLAKLIFLDIAISNESPNERKNRIRIIFVYQTFFLSRRVKNHGNILYFT